jgi:agmatinase
MGSAGSPFPIDSAFWQCVAEGGVGGQTTVMTFDPDAPAAANAGLYGLGGDVATAAAVVIPVPFEATVSYRTGTQYGPRAVTLASMQVDLFDADFGAIYEAGIAMVDVDEGVVADNAAARVAATRVIDAHENGADIDPADIAVVDAAGGRVNAFVFAAVDAALDNGQLPVVLGGDHSVPLAAIVACAKRLGDKPMGILHLDAHLDLRDAYEGFRYSHASIMKNVLDATTNVSLVQVGIRDFSQGELDVVRAEPDRVRAWFDVRLRDARLSGGMAAVIDDIVSALPDDVYLSFDIDGLDPTLCPSTGTPVPGGLSFDDVSALLVAVVRHKKRVVGLDLVEVAPDAASLGDDDAMGQSYDANVGARLLYKMLGCALASRQAIPGNALLPSPKR